MKNAILSAEQSKTFASVFSVEEIKRYIADHRCEYERFCTEEAEKNMASKRKRISRKATQQAGKSLA